MLNSVIFFIELYIQIALIYSRRIYLGLKAFLKVRECTENCNDTRWVFSGGEL